MHFINILFGFRIFYSPLRDDEVLPSLQHHEVIQHHRVRDKSSKEHSKSKSNKLRHNTITTTDEHNVKHEQKITLRKKVFI